MTKSAQWGGFIENGHTCEEKHKGNIESLNVCNVYSIGYNTQHTDITTYRLKPIAYRLHLREKPENHSQIYQQLYIIETLTEDVILD